MSGEAILVIDDEEVMRDVMSTLLGEEGYRVTLAGDGAEGLALARKGSFDAAIVDVSLPDIDGFEVAARLRERGSRSAIVLTSSRDGADFGTLVTDSPARGFVPKGELSGDAVRALVAS